MHPQLKITCTKTGFVPYVREEEFEYIAEIVFTDVYTLNFTRKVTFMYYYYEKHVDNYVHGYYNYIKNKVNTEKHVLGISLLIEKILELTQNPDNITLELIHPLTDELILKYSSKNPSEIIESGLQAISKLYV